MQRSVNRSRIEPSFTDSSKGENVKRGTVIDKRGRKKALMGSRMLQVMK